MKRIFLLSIALLISITGFSAQRVSMMTYNVENLFDWEHDDGKLDYTYLPLAEKKQSKEIRAYCASQGNYFYKKECFELNWAPEVVRVKIHNIAEMIRAAEANGPDILVLNEVENINVVRMLVEWELADMGYQTVELLEGPDRRGIDVAILSKFPQTQAPKLHLVDLSAISNGRSNTRGILEVQLDVYGLNVSVFANHWPSMANPNSYREIAAATLNQAAASAGTPYVFALGDFNSLDEDPKAGINTITLNPNNPDFFYDSRLNTTIYSDSDVGGSHYYRGEWSFLDKILIYNKAIRTEVASIGLEYMRIVSPAFALYEAGKGNKKALAPYRFNASTGRGVSDHLPILLSLQIQ